MQNGSIGAEIVAPDSIASMKSQPKRDRSAHIFLLSPARSEGRRAAMLIRPQATFQLARQLQIGDAELADVFAFCSGLYFRGKLAYARHFMRPPEGLPGVLIITPSRGLLPPCQRVGVSDMQEFASVNVDASEPLFTKPLEESVRSLAATATDCDIILLGSIATGKYVDVLLPLLGEALRFPSEFVGRGDMSRGGLLLRCAALGKELDYLSVASAVRTGRRPARLGVIKRTDAPPGLC
jgi:hypothetical protein